MSDNGFNLQEFGDELKKISESIQKLASEIDEPAMNKQASSSTDGSFGRITSLPGNKGSNPLLDFVLS